VATFSLDSKVVFCFPLRCGWGARLQDPECLWLVASLDACGDLPALR